ncbi:serine/threonine-protein kinase EDR1-like [Rutidosis leptorrhynchoides]|uniref:serine/threonine-protein kinase EDR1-like n=1 Tax=Rutidosis leptorrhynchoides TaxID=125765 RepID=UPI003A9906B1
MEKKKGMKNIFKKLHIGSSSSNSSSNQNDPNRSSTDSSSPNVTADHRVPSSTSAGQIAVQSPSSVATPASPTVNVPATRQQDYYSSEEEYQVQLALALSVSNSESRGGSESDSDQIRAAKLLSLGKQSNSNNNNTNINNNNYNNYNHVVAVDKSGDAVVADKLSRQYWDYGLLDYEEKVVDGFYDIYGNSTEMASQGKIPSLSDLETDPGTSGFEVIIVNKTVDPALEELLQVAHCIGLDCPPAEINLLVQRLAELVTEQMGGPVKDANVILEKWIERSTELRTSLHTSIYPIGSLRVGLLRHRALLFKVLAESVGITCRLVKGGHYTGGEDDAVNIIKLDNESEFLIDLMAAPGTLIPAEIFSSKDSSLKSYMPKSSKLQDVHSTKDSGAMLNKTNDGSSQNLEPLISMTNTGATGIGLSQSGKQMLPSSQLDHIPSSAIGSSLYKGGRGPNPVGGGSRMNVNIVPYTQNNVEDDKNLFTDLNPFKIKGSGKALMQNNSVENKNERAKINQVPGRPPVPLMWKNRHAMNEIPGKKQHDYINYRETNDSSVAESSKIHSDSVTSKVNNATGSSNTAELEAAWAEWKTYRLSLEVVGTNSNAVPRNNRLDHEKVYENNASSGQDVRKTSEDHVNSNNPKLTVPESSSSSAYAFPPQIDPVIDDVGDCEIPWEDLVIGERIGLGSYGEVYHADWNGTEVAVKKFLDQDFSGAALAEFKREVRIMQRLRHPNIVLFMGAVTRPPNLSIISEFLPRGSLYRIIHRPQCQIDEKRRIKMALDVAKGMYCLHSSVPTIVHRDLKSPNLLVDEDWNVKVCDFGLSRLKHNTFLSSKSTAGTPEWMAPEVLRNENSNEKCDVYSFGVILWELATLRLPWSGMNPMQVVGAVGFQNRRLDIPKDLDPLVGRIIWECWQTDPNLRPSFQQLTTALKPLQRLAASPQTDQPIET